MGIKINSGELLKVLEGTPGGHNIMLVGSHGIGKPEIIENFFVAQNKKVVKLFLGQMSDPGDIIGLPSLNTSAKVTEFLPPFWFPVDGKAIVLFLDELNRARPEILQAVMNLTLNKTIAGKKLPEGSQIISAVNEGQEYQLTDLDPALLSRFNVYYFAPTPSEWLLWAAKNNISNLIIDFIEKNPDFLDLKLSVEGDTDLEKSVDRRAWVRVSQIISTGIEMDKTFEKIIAGVVGISAALKFSAFIKNNKTINPKDVLTNFVKHKSALKKLSTVDLTILNDGLFRIIETFGVQEGQSSDKEFSSLFQMIDSQKTNTDIGVYIKNLELYIAWLIDDKKDEVLAHWATVYEANTYQKAKVAILKNSPYIFNTIVNFIKGIKV